MGGLFLARDVEMARTALRDPIWLALCFDLHGLMRPRQLGRHGRPDWRRHEGLPIGKAYRSTCRPTAEGLCRAWPLSESSLRAACQAREDSVNGEIVLYPVLPFLGRKEHTPPYSSEELSLPKKNGGHTAATEERFRW